MFALVIEYTRLLVRVRRGHDRLLRVFSTPMRTLPLSAFTALPSVTGHCVEPVFADVIVIGVVGQNASCPGARHGAHVDAIADDERARHPPSARRDPATGW